MPGLIDRLIQDGVLRTPRIIEAFKEVSRENFVPENLRIAATEMDEALSIGFGQTVSQPWTVAFMLELLQPEAGQKILDIGAGSGWQTALLAHIVSQNGSSKSQAPNSGRVYAIERVPELCSFGKKNLEKYNFIKRGVVEWFCKDATSGLQERAPFDRIIAAAAVVEIPDAWRRQCAVGGVIVAPVKGSVCRFVKKSDENWENEEHPGFAFVPFVYNKGGELE